MAAVVPWRPARKGVAGVEEQVDDRLLHHCAVAMDARHFGLHLELEDHAGRVDEQIDLALVGCPHLEIDDVTTPRRSRLAGRVDGEPEVALEERGASAAIGAGRRAGARRGARLPSLADTSAAKLDATSACSRAKSSSADANSRCSSQ